MNVLFVFNVPIVACKGGVQRVTTVLGAEFEHKGHTVVNLCCNDSVQTSGANAKEPQLYLNTKLSESQQTQWLDRLIKERQVDVVIDQLCDFKPVRLISRIIDRPLIISVFHSQPYAFINKERRMMMNFYPSSFSGHLFKVAGLICPWFTRWFYSRTNIFLNTLEYCDRLCLLSNRFINRLIENTPGIDRNKVLAINNPNTFQTSENSHLPQKDKTVICVGRIYNLSKNMLDFLKSWRIVSRSCPDWKAIVVGDGPDLQRLKAYASRHGLKSVEFTGHKSDVEKYYKDSSICCIPSINEGWPMVATEAMSQGCVPCVYDTFEAIHDIVETGKNGIIVRPFDVEAMAGAIIKLINDDELRNRLEVNAMKSVRQFAPDIIASRWIEQINQLVHERNR